MRAPDDLRDRLAADIGPVPLRDLAIHHLKGALFVVQRGLALADAAVALVRDDAAAVSGWLEQGTLRKSADADLAAWPQTAEYRVVVIHPYVLVEAPPDA